MDVIKTLVKDWTWRDLERPAVGGWFILCTTPFSFSDSLPSGKLT